MLHIEGLDPLTEHDLTQENDTPPDAIIVWFEVKSEYMPALSLEKGERVYKSFVHRCFIKELGWSSGNRRIKDKVEFDEATGKWKVLQLAPAGQSDLKKWPNQWNKFARGTKGSIDGTPIEFLFKQMPERAEMFKKNHVETIEMLASLTDGDCQRGGMGWFDDRTKARAHIAKAKDGAAEVKMNARIQSLEESLKEAAKQNRDLQDKLEILLKSQIEAASKREAPVKSSAPKKGGKRPKHPQAISNEDIQIEGVE